MLELNRWLRRRRLLAAAELGFGNSQFLDHLVKRVTAVHDLPNAAAIADMTHKSRGKPRDLALRLFHLFPKPRFHGFLLNVCSADSFRCLALLSF
ncbi:MAG: hypothetical protein HYW51_03250 [Candidatus Doudnabacteria bacterium]|nr:hypothetical protein [Candidatus Doudnabacteria bacterium]